MDFSAIGSSLHAALGTQLPRILGAIVILIIGWIVAVIVRAGVRRLLGMARLNGRIAETTEQKLDLESGIAAGAFWLIILITLIGVFNSLDLVLASGPFEVLVKQIAGYIPHLVAGTVLVLVAWLAAIALRAIVNRVLDASGLDEKLSANAGMEPMRKSVGNMLFWLVILLFLPAILDAYNLGGLLDPVKAMVSKALDDAAECVRRVCHRLRRLAARQGARRAGDQHPCRCRRRSGCASPGARRHGANLASRRHHRADLRVRARVDRRAGCAQDRGDIETRDRHAGQDAGGGSEHRCRSADPRRHLLRRRSLPPGCSRAC